jgi:hypothetical protein
LLYNERVIRVLVAAALAAAGCSERALSIGDDVIVVPVVDGSTESPPDLSSHAAPSFSDPILGTQLVGQPWSITIADIDQDGHPDALVGTNETAGVAYGKGDGTFSPFEDFKLFNSREVIAADLDNDGWQELIVAQADNEVSATGAVVILRGKQGHGFVVDRTLVVGDRPYSVRVAELNGDAAPDILVAGKNGSFIFLPGPTFAPAASRGPGRALWRIGWADFDQDGLLDCFAAGSAGAPVGNGILALGMASGFAPAVATPGPIGYVATGDLDGDGHPDAVIVDEGTNEVYTLRWNQSSFESPTRSTLSHANAYAAAAGDLDGDGLVDLVTTNGNFAADGSNRSDFVDAYRSDGHGSFIAIAHLQGIGFPYDAAAIADLDSDGHNDIIVGDRVNKVLTTFLNRGR